MTKGCEKEERLVYQIIEDADNKGIWMRDIRFKSNLPRKPLTRILKVLENKKLIKSVKTVRTPTRKIYMLHGLTPDESLTGGAWYSDQDFESEFVEVLSQHCLKFLQQKVGHRDKLASTVCVAAVTLKQWLCVYCLFVCFLFVFFLGGGGIFTIF